MSLDSNLAAVIKRIESSNNGDAIRYEAMVMASITKGSYARSVYHAKQSNPTCSDSTARMICSTSWGYYQLMGFNVYDERFGYRKSIMQFMKSADDQNYVLEKFLNSIAAPTLTEMLNNETSLIKFTNSYNGPGNVEAYMQKIKTAAHDLHFT